MVEKDIFAQTDWPNVQEEFGAHPEQCLVERYSLKTAYLRFQKHKLN